ncbi:MAG: hypothetical protein M3464_19385 [Chloroflexota bacterium]|nr:hypothetical protein [Chloroflexota bacterium]
MSRQQEVGGHRPERPRSIEPSVVQGQVIQADAGHGVAHSDEPVRSGFAAKLPGSGIPLAVLLAVAVAIALWIAFAIWQSNRAVSVAIIAVVLVVVGRYVRQMRQCGRDDLPGVVFNMRQAIDEVSEGTRAGLPDDGRMWLIHAIQQCGRSRLLWEGAASIPEAESYLERLASEYGRRFSRVNRLSMGTLDGLYSIKGHRGHTEFVTILSLSAFGAKRANRELRSALGFDHDR